jgi:DNA-directed RNA polymerase subunit M/transcription elongation factor TFIIS
MTEVSTTNNEKEYPLPRKTKATCHHEIDPTTETYDPKYGRRGICKHCGNEIYFMRFARTKTGKVKMSKKERLRRRRELTAALDKMVCPKCNAVGMVAVNVKSKNMLKCKKCGGIFELKKRDVEDAKNE